MSTSRPQASSNARPAETEPTIENSRERDEAYSLVYDEAVRRLVAQEQTLDELRSRCGILIAAATIVTTFLGAQFIAAKVNTFTSAQSLALFMFAASVVFAVIPLIPIPGWAFYFGTRKLLKDYLEAPQPMVGWELRRDLALHLEDNYRHNSSRITALQLSLLLSVIALIVEVLAWSYDIGWRPFG